MNTPFDDLAKDVIEALCSPYVRVEKNPPLSQETQFPDILASPIAGKDTHPLRRLGIVGKMVRGRVCVLEFFSTSVTVLKIRECLDKQRAVHRRLLAEERQNRERERQETGISESHRQSLPALPRAYVILAADSPRVRQYFGSTIARDWVRGVFCGYPSHNVWFVVVPHLPRTRSTLPLRLLGRGRLLMRAVQEVQTLPFDDPMRTPLREALSRCKLAIGQEPSPSKRQKQFQMITDQAFQQFKHEVRQEGALDHAARSVLAVIEVRGLAITKDQREHILDCKDLATLDRWLRAAITASTVAELFTEPQS